MTAVAADPNSIAIFREDFFLADITKEFPVALFVGLFNRRDAFKLFSEFFETFFASGFGEAFVHVGPFVIFASGCSLEIGFGIFDGAAVKFFIPHLGVFFFIVGGFEENRGDLFEAIFFSFRGEESVFIARFGLAGESFL